MFGSNKNRFWKEEDGFPKFQILFYKESKDPPVWFCETLLTAFIHKYEKMTDFEDLMKRWKNLESVQHRDRAFELFSQNEVALPYLSMGFNSISKRNGGSMSSDNIIDVDNAYLNDYESQKSELSIAEYVTKKVDLSSMVDRTYGFALYAIWLYRKDKPTDYPAFTQEDVKAFLENVFKNDKNKPETNAWGFSSFFQAIKNFEQAAMPESEESTATESPYGPPLRSLRRSTTPKEQEFFETTFNIIKDLPGFPEYLNKLKDFVHDLNKFVEFAKVNESLIMPNCVGFDPFDAFHQSPSWRPY